MCKADFDHKINNTSALKTNDVKLKASLSWGFSSLYEELVDYNPIFYSISFLLYNFLSILTNSHHGQ